MCPKSCSLTLTTQQWGEMTPLGIPEGNALGKNDTLRTHMTRFTPIPMDACLACGLGEGLVGMAHGQRQRESGSQNLAGWVSSCRNHCDEAPSSGGDTCAWDLITGSRRSSDVCQFLFPRLS